jgi:ketosteroid isomerase-like protein
MTNEEPETTRELVDKYHEGISTKSDWGYLLSDDFLLTGTIVTESRGRDAYANNNFFKLVKSLKVEKLLIEGENAAAIVNYDLVSPKGKSFSSTVAEFWNVKNGKLDSVAIYFDTTDFQKSMS